MKAKLFFLIFFISVFSIQAQTNSTAVMGGDHETEVVIYPNPAVENVNLKVVNRTLKLRSITIYSIIGKAVADYRNLNQNSASLRIDNLRPGKYLVKYLLSDGSQHVTQLIKQ